MRVTVAWCLFVLGALFIVADIAAPPLQPTGLMFAGTFLLLVWLWFIGGFTRAFWITDDVTSRRLDEVDQEIDEEGHR